MNLCETPNSASWPFPPWLCAALPLALWSMNAVISRALLLHGSGAFDVLCWRALGGIAFGVLLLRCNPFSNMKAVFTMAGLFCVLNLICYNMALKYINAYLVMVLETSCFIFSMAYSLCRRERVHICKLAVAFFAIGLALLYINAAKQENANLLLGLFWGILCSATFGLLNSTLGSVDKSVPKVFAISVPCFLASLPVAAWDSANAAPSLVDSLVALGILGVLCTGAAYHFWGKASEHYSGVSLSMLFMLTLPGTFLTELIFLKMPLCALELAASGILVAGALANAMLKPSPNADLQASETQEQDGMQADEA